MVRKCQGNTSIGTASAHSDRLSYVNVKVINIEEIRNFVSLGWSGYATRIFVWRLQAP